ncbi:hypothetical protein HDC90_000460 [Pedobacter sp. AK013]|nr:hypothetical protein [Pedobacter sp. AK013]
MRRSGYSNGLTKYYYLYFTIVPVFNIGPNITQKAILPAVENITETGSREAIQNGIFPQYTNH